MREIHSKAENLLVAESFEGGIRVEKEESERTPLILTNLHELKRIYNDFEWVL